MDAYVPLGEIMYFRVAMSNATTSAPSDATGSVAWAIYEESTTAEVSSGTMTKNGTVTGLYWGSATLAAGSGFEVGKWYDLYVAGTAGTSGHVVLHTFRIGSTESTVGAINAYAQSGGTLDANVVNWKGSAAEGTQGGVGMRMLNGTTLNNPVSSNLPVDVRAMAAGVITSSQFVADALGATAFASAAIQKFTTAMATGTVGTALGTISANVVAILGTVAVATAGTFTNIGTAGTALGTITASGTVTASTVLATVAANVTQINGTAAAGTQGTIRAVVTDGTIGTVTGTVTATVTGTPQVDVVLLKGTGIAGTQGTMIVVAASGTVSTVLSLATVAANVTQVLGTAAGGTQGTLEVSVSALTAARSTLGTITAAAASPLQQLDWMYAVSYGQVTQDATSQVVFNAGGTAIATATVSGDTNSFTRGAFA